MRSQKCARSMPSVNCVNPVGVVDGWKSGDASTGWTSWLPSKLRKMLPSGNSKSTTTGMMGAVSVVVKPRSGDEPIIAYGHVDCGLPWSSKPGAVNASTKFGSESIPGTPSVDEPMDCALSADFSAGSFG